MIPHHARQIANDRVETFGSVFDAVRRVPRPDTVNEFDFNTVNLWDKLDIETREAVVLAAGFPAKFAQTPWAQMSKHEKRALKRVWDPAVGE